MRCLTCGTENTPDSRFCGGCGAKVSGIQPRLAPTTKIADDVPMYAAPAAIPTPPPGMMRAPSVPSSRPPAPSPAGSLAASLSLPVVPQRRWGLILFVLVIDLGLAGAGAVLLAKGLAKPEPKPAAATSTSLAPAAAPQAVTTAEIAPIEPAPPAPSPAAPAAPAAPPAKLVASRTPAHHASKPPAKSPPTPIVKAIPPEDPPPGATADLPTLVDRAIADAVPQFVRCQQTAGTVHGSIRIAFQVLPDGHVAHGAPVENTTGSDALASCLTAVIAAFAFAPHSGDAADFVRPFQYP